MLSQSAFSGIPGGGLCIYWDFVLIPSSIVMSAAIVIGQALYILY